LFKVLKDIIISRKKKKKTIGQRLDKGADGVTDIGRQIHARLEAVSVFRLKGAPP
jgi:hypothetical protein